MKAERVPHLGACAVRWFEERHHRVPSQSISEVIAIKLVQNVSRYEARVEREGHGGGNGATKLCSYCRVVRQC